MQGSTKVTEDEKVRDEMSQQGKSSTSKVVAALAIASGCCVALKHVALGGMLALCAAALREHGKRGAGDGTTPGTSTRASSMGTNAGGGTCCLRMLRAGSEADSQRGRKSSRCWTYRVRDGRAWCRSVCLR